MTTLHTRRADGIAVEKSLTVAELPSAAGLAGARAFVTEMPTPRFSPQWLVAEVSTAWPVYCDGTDWRIG